MNPERRSPRLSLAIPSSLVSELPQLREKTVIIGMIGRAAAIFRVGDIHIYPESPDEAGLIQLILRYLETPQYLRKQLFGKRDELAYAGALSPLRTPHHPLERRAAKLRKGEVREGVVLEEVEEAFLVDIGVEKPIKATGRSPSVGGRATVRVTETRPELMGTFIGRGDVESYWGYGVHVSRESLGRLAQSKEFDLTIATSRLGAPFPSIEQQLRERWRMARSVLVAFGSPKGGLKEVLARERQTLDEAFHFTVNTIPGQGCETVRTEEAVYATLAILNLMDERPSKFNS